MKNLISVFLLLMSITIFSQTSGNTPLPREIFVRCDMLPGAFYQYLEEGNFLQIEGYLVEEPGKTASMKMGVLSLDHTFELLIELGGDTTVAKVIIINLYLTKSLLNFESDDSIILDLALLISAGEGDRRIVNLALNSGADPNGLAGYGAVLAGINGNLKVLKMLEESGINFELFYEYLLLSAVENGHFNIVRYL